MSSFSRVLRALRSFSIWIPKPLQCSDMLSRKFKTVEMNMVRRAGSVALPPGDG